MSIETRNWTLEGTRGEKKLNEKGNHFGAQRNLAREKACTVIKKGKSHKSPFKSAELL